MYLPVTCREWAGLIGLDDLEGSDDLYEQERK